MSNKCKWFQMEEDNYDCPYDTGCGRTFQLIEGTPEENDIKFCNYCGKEVEQVLHEPDRG